jgi:hypothetical protein
MPQMITLLKDETDLQKCREEEINLKPLHFIATQPTTTKTVIWIELGSTPSVQGEKNLP